MAKYEHNPGKGNLFLNTEKKSEEAPDLKGSFKLPNGEDYDIALWYATDKETGEKRKDVNGKNFFTAKIQEPYIKESNKEKEAEETSDLPF